MHSPEGFFKKAGRHGKREIPAQEETIPSKLSLTTIRKPGAGTVLTG